MRQIPAVEPVACTQSTDNFGVDRFSHTGNWYAVFTMPRHEKRVQTHCRERKIESFLPLYSVRHRWKNRCNVKVELPLFPNYLFVRIDSHERVSVLGVPGVLYMVSSGRELLPIQDQYIDSLRRGLLTYRIEPHPNVEVGDRVCIASGPMAGMEGILERQKNGMRVVIKLEMIGRSIAVEVGAEEITYFGPPRLVGLREVSSPLLVNQSRS